MSEEDLRVVENVVKIVNFLTKGSSSTGGPGSNGSSRGSALMLNSPAVVAELLPVLPTVATEVMPQLTSALISRISARVVRELYA